MYIYFKCNFNAFWILFYVSMFMQMMNIGRIWVYLILQVDYAKI